MLWQLRQLAMLPLLLKHSAKVKFVNTIHDSAWFYVKEEYTSKVVPKLEQIMSATPTLFKKYLGVDVPFLFPDSTVSGVTTSQNLKHLKRRIGMGSSREYNKIYTTAYYEKNKEREKNRVKSYREANIDMVNSKQREHYYNKKVLIAAK